MEIIEARRKLENGGAQPAHMRFEVDTTCRHDQGKFLFKFANSNTYSGATICAYFRIQSMFFVASAISIDDSDNVSNQLSQGKEAFCTSICHVNAMHYNNKYMLHR